MNSFVVRPIPINTQHNKYRGQQILPIKHANIIIVARKASGKTCLVSALLDHLLEKGECVSIFCATHDKDPSYEHIKKNLEKNESPLFCAHDIVDAQGECLITRFLDADKKGESYTNVLDDLTDTCRAPIISRLMMTNRHHLARNIISVQSVVSLLPASWKQADYVFLLGGLETSRLQKIYDVLTLHTSFETFMRAYEHATRIKYDFLCIDINRNLFIHNLKNIL